jgi:hypothetical protein
MDIYKEAFFSHIVKQFLEQHCEMIPGKSVRGQVLFHRFRDYWNEVTHGARHPALLGQFRVELTKQGYASSGGKWPRWYNLTLRKKKRAKASEQAIQQGLSAFNNRVDHARPEASQTYSLAHYQEEACIS